MYVDRTPSRYPRRGGPSCLTIVLGLVVLVVAFYLTSNAEQVMDAIIPTPTPEPTLRPQRLSLPERRGVRPVGGEL